MRKVYVGINAYSHDSALAVVEEGEVVYAAQEERFTRIKFDNAAPKNALKSALRYLNVSHQNIAGVGYFEMPEQKLERILTTHSDADRLLAFSRRWDQNNIPIEMLRAELGFSNSISSFGHHLCHAAYSFYSSGLRNSLVMVNDGVGEWDTTTFWRASTEKIERLGGSEFPNSFGLFYAAITSFLGFRPNADEYKVMGMAPYGKIEYFEECAKLISVSDGIVKLNCDAIDVFDMRNASALSKLFDIPRRAPWEALSQVHFDLAASAQAVLENLLLDQLTFYQAKFPTANLCLGGGVSLNCVANARIVKSGLFERVWAPPGVDDPGNAIGAAYLAAIADGVSPKPLESAFLGEEYSDEAIGVFLDSLGASYQKFELSILCDEVAQLLADGKVVGWFNGRAEFGARALGARSILADARIPGMRDHVNSAIKHRESFRPFAPICLSDRANEYFEVAQHSPFMTFTCSARSPQLIPAVTHVDGSARLQSVERTDQTAIAQLLKAFEQRTACPLLLNTSFNLSDEPIVLTPSDAFNTFRESDIDVLVLGSFLLKRSAQHKDIMHKGTASLQSLARSLSPLTHHTYFFS